MNRGINFKYLDYNDIEYIVVHHSATNPKQKVTAEIIDRWHRDRGWLAGGYHWVIRRDGCIEPGRYIDQVGAHVKGHNDKSIGICLAGGLDQDGQVVDNFTDAQYRSLTALHKAIGPDLPLRLHNELADTECSKIDLLKIPPH